ncbi:MAG: hypothetical protein COA96_16430 [SAR86 cluster bacterium]|uniref:PEP-CTERM protein-sorting domain-containing protein n=1 Tax=SAR86 cluster bacterium TaxID=2030880 RepID=A0A2A5AIY0_9GAMM|nr:MAG: hypothetical protein COA96_16430 [SAR86 cluster bacterium]
MLKLTCSFCFSSVLLLSLIQSAFAVPIDGRNWMQVSDTVNFTYNNLATGPCDVVTGACSGVASNHLATSIDLTGWVWASSSDVADLFEYLTGAPAGTFDVNATNYPGAAGDSWGADVIDIDSGGPDAGLFAASGIFSSNDYWIAGLTRTIINGDTDRSYIRSSGGHSSAVVGNPHGFNTARSHTGLWLYQPSSVSEPSALLLLLSSMIFLGLRKQKSRRTIGYAHNLNNLSERI